LRGPDGRNGRSAEQRKVSEVLGLVLGLGIGSACRWFDIPVPAPPRIVGALLVVAMTLGFMAADFAIAR
jgi:XapX domain-containing protein